MTKILAIDTTFGACSVAILSGDEVLATKKEVRARGHVERLLPMIEEVRKSADLELSEMDFVATTIGPGTFAGVRVGLSAAKGMCLALEVPLIPVVSLDAIAAEFYAFNPDFDGELMVAMDARRGEVYLRGYDISQGQSRSIYEPAALSIENAEKKLENRLITVIGSGANLLLDCGDLELRQYHNPSAEYVAKVASQNLQHAASCHEVSPLYLRAPDAIKPAPISMVVVDE